MNLELRPLQEKAIAAVQQAFRDGHKRVMLQAPCGMGKCHGVDTKILMSDGSIKLVQNVEVGDKLLAPDGKARNVISLGRGRENMFRVVPVKGDSYIVNESHILSLRKHGEDGMILSNGRHIPRNSDLVTLTVREFLDANKTVQTNLKGWRASAVNFPDAKQDSHLIPPYILGVWLGDGSSREPAITKPQTKMLDEWIAYVYSLGMKITVDSCGGRCPTHHARNETGRGKNQITEALRSLNLIQNKHIPQSYKTASIEDRLQLLAGLIDSDGHQTRGCYDWLSKHEVLARDFAFVVRSVGLSCYVSKCKKSIKSLNFVGEYWRCIVSGDTARIPARDKPADARLINKRNLIHGISIEPIGEGDYYGFELNGDHLYLLDDFTVCHNTEIATAMLIKTHANMKRGAFICDRLSLIEQTGERFDKYGLKYGVMQAQHVKTDKRERIQLCSIQTIAKKEWPEVELLMADEAHVMPKALAERIDKQDCYVVGLSATPFTKGLGQHFDIVINAATTNELIEMGWLVPYRVFAVAEPDLTDVKIVGGEWDEKQLESKVLPVVGDCVAEYQKLGEGKKFICFAVSILHAAELKRQFAEAGIITELYTYKESAEEKIEAVNEFRKPDSYIRGLISIESLTRGFDVSDIEVLILARPLRNAIAVHIQMMGRVLRTSTATGKKMATILDHSGNCARFWNQVADFFENGISVLDDGKKKSKEEVEKAKPKDKEAAKCPKCSMIHEAKICPGCGFEYIRASGVLHIAGELSEIKGGKSFSMEFKQNFYSELLTYATSKGYADGWVLAHYKQKFSVWPNQMKRELKPLSEETSNFIKHRIIAFAKAKAKAAT